MTILGAIKDGGTFIHSGPPVVCLFAKPGLIRLDDAEGWEFYRSSRLSADEVEVRLLPGSCPVDGWAVLREGG